MNLTLIAVMIVVVTFAISYGESARKTKSNQEVLALQGNFFKGCLVSLVLLLLPVFESLAFPKPQPHLATVTFIVESALIALFGFLELRKLNYRKVKLFCLLALHVGIALVWWQLFSYYQMEQGIFNSPSFTLVPFMVWAAAIVVVAFTYLDGPKLRTKKLSKTESENAKLREQIERMQNERNRLKEDNEKLRSVVQGTKSGTTKSKSVTEDKKAESNPPKNTQTGEDSATQVDEAQTTTSVPKSDAEDKPKVTNPSMTGAQQQKLSEILDRLASDPSPEAQQAAIQELVKNYRTAAIKKAIEEFTESHRTATAKKAIASEEETLSQGPKSTDFEVSFEEEEQEEPEEEVLDGDDGEDDTIFADLFAKISPATVALTAAIILVIYVTVLVLA